MVCFAEKEEKWNVPTNIYIQIVYLRLSDFNQSHLITKHFYSLLCHKPISGILTAKDYTKWYDSNLVVIFYIRVLFILFSLHHDR